MISKQDYNRKYFQSEKGKTAHKKYQQSEKGKLAIKKYYKSEKGKATKRKADKRYRQKNKDKANAHIILHRAVKSGIVIKQCCIRCGDINAEAHHDDYNKPLDVIWLCPKHHQEVHRGKT